MWTTNSTRLVCEYFKTLSVCSVDFDMCLMSKREFKYFRCASLYRVSSVGLLSLPISFGRCFSSDLSSVIGTLGRWQGWRPRPLTPQTYNKNSNHQTKSEKNFILHPYIYKVEKGEKKLKSGWIHGVICPRKGRNVHTWRMTKWQAMKPISTNGDKKPVQKRGQIRWKWVLMRYTEQIAKMNAICSKWAIRTWTPVFTGVVEGLIRRNYTLFKGWFVGGCAKKSPKKGGQNRVMSGLKWMQIRG